MREKRLFTTATFHRRAESSAGPRIGIDPVPTRRSTSRDAPETSAVQPAGRPEGVDAASAWELSERRERHPSLPPSGSRQNRREGGRHQTQRATSADTGPHSATARAASRKGTSVTAAPRGTSNRAYPATASRPSAYRPDRAPQVASHLDSDTSYGPATQERYLQLDDLSRRLLVALQTALDNTTDM